jgi:hypothetical protein
MGERVKDITRHGPAARRESQPFQTDHRVAAPFGEPVVSCNHGANLVTGGVGLGGVGDATRRGNDKLVRR